MTRTTRPGGSELPSIMAVIVTYFPDSKLLHRTLDAIAPQVDGLVVVDNGSGEDAYAHVDATVHCRMHCIRLDENLGIAAAQNRGITWARSQGADYILLFDQDSEPAADMVQHLSAVALKLAAESVPVALVVPNYTDDRQSQDIPFMHIVNGRPQWFGCKTPDGVAEITTAIASGSLIPISTINRVGPMRESMFIDLVDIEWCFRARAAGYRAFGVCNARLRHSLGEPPKRILGRTLATHSPKRNYYFYRNAIWLFRQGYVPAVWKRVVAGQMLKRYLIFPLGVRPRWQYLKMMTLGVWHGLIGRSGAL